MSVANFEFEATVRDDLGKGASRRLRRDDKVLGVVYGGDEAATSIVLEHRLVARALEHEAVYSHILGLTINGKKQKVVLRDLQRHPYKPIIMHMDFLRVKESDLINMKVPVHFINEEKCPGVLNGGILNHLVSELEIRCQAGKLPEFIEVDVANLELDQDILLSQVKVASGIELTMLSHGHDIPVVAVHKPRQTKLDEEQAAEEMAAATAQAAAAAEAAAEAGAVAGTLEKDKEKATAKPEAKDDKHDKK